MKDYITIAKKADELAESICRECSKQRTAGNSVSVFYDTFYPAIFLEVFHDMIQSAESIIK
jgi:hypothetical protein